MKQQFVTAFGSKHYPLPNYSNAAQCLAESVRAPASVELFGYLLDFSGID
jgi:hypothetical protein